MSTKLNVLNVYKKIMRLSNEWIAKDGNSTLIERNFIKNEARELFKLNKNLKNENEINEHLREAEARIELGIHYQNPYPRLVNLPTYTLHSKSKHTKSEVELRKRSIPIYMKSQYKD